MPVLGFFRPYSPEFVGWFRDFGQTTANYDANGHYARISPAFNAFNYDQATDTLVPLPDEPARCRPAERRRPRRHLADAARPALPRRGVAARDRRQLAVSRPRRQARLQSRDRPARPMRRLLAIALVIGCAATLAIFSLGAGDDGGGYRVRAIFDNAGFAITGMDVKIAGVKVGKIASLDVTKDKKAAIVLDITDKDFQDWRKDATCRIRPQSLIGEKFIECLPTQPRGAGEQAPPPLQKIKEGDGEGEFLLPATNTSGAVDLDLVNNINRLPYRERFTIILNEFGTGLAGNGAALQTALKKSDPALKALDDVLLILAKQNKTLVAARRQRRQGPRAARAREGAHHRLHPQRRHLRAGDRRAQRRLQGRPAASSRRSCASSARRCRRSARSRTRSRRSIDDLSRSAASLNTFVTGTPAFTDVSTPALTSLGDATETIGPTSQKSLPLVKDLGTLGKSTVPLTKNLGATLLSLRQEGGIQNLLSFIFRFAGSSNAYDQFGHYVRARLVLGTCQSYVTRQQLRLHGELQQGQGRGHDAARSGPGVDRERAGLRRSPSPSAAASGAARVDARSSCRRRCCPATSRRRAAGRLEVRPGPQRRPAPPRLPPRRMRRRRGNTSIAANPVLIGAATTLVVIVAVFLAYNANSGLPFIPTYDIQRRGPERRRPRRRQRRAHGRHARRARSRRSRRSRSPTGRSPASSTSSSRSSSSRCRPTAP